MKIKNGLSAAILLRASDMFLIIKENDQGILFCTAKITFIILLCVIIIKVVICGCKSETEHHLTSPFKRCI